jgi:hypothetical protein
MSAPSCRTYWLRAFEATITWQLQLSITLHPLSRFDYFQQRGVRMPVARRRAQEQAVLTLLREFPYRDRALG